MEYLKEVCTQSVAIRRGCLHPAQTLASQTQKRPALLLGSETNKVLTHCKIPVLVTR